MLSGQKVNFDKCEISFSKRLEPRIWKVIKDSLGFVEVVMHDKYLGFPTVFIKSKRISFAGLRDRMWKKLQGWKEKLLSSTGKEVLI